MRIKKCQMDFIRPCSDRGYICLKSEKEKRAFNKEIERLQAALEKIKFKDPEELNKIN